MALYRISILLILIVIHALASRVKPRRTRQMEAGKYHPDNAPGDPLPPTTSTTIAPPPPPPPPPRKQSRAVDSIPAYQQGPLVYGQKILLLGCACEKPFCGPPSSPSRSRKQLIDWEEQGSNADVAAHRARINRAAKCGEEYGSIQVEFAYFVPKAFDPDGSSDPREHEGQPLQESDFFRIYPKDYKGDYKEYAHDDINSGDGLFMFAWVNRKNGRYKATFQAGDVIVFDRAPINQYHCGAFSSVEWIRDKCNEYAKLKDVFHFRAIPLGPGKTVDSKEFLSSLGGSCQDECTMTTSKHGNSDEKTAQVLNVVQEFGDDGAANYALCKKHFGAGWFSQRTKCCVCISKLSSPPALA